MKLALIVVAAIVGTLILVAAVAALIGSRMPTEHTIARSLQIKKSPADVYAVIRNVEEAPRWRSDVKRVEILSSDRFREHGRNGTVTYQIVDDVPGKRMATKILDLNLGYSGSWEYVLEGSGGGTQLTITEKGVVTNPLFRFMSRYVFGYTATIDAYLRSLEGKLLQNENGR
jgi:hypothetical protein